MKFTIALAQIDSKLGDLSGNARLHIEFIRNAKGRGAGLVVFPELSLSGYTLKDATWEAAIRPGGNPVIDGIVAEGKGISVLLGCVEESPDMGIHNAAFLIENGVVTSVHRKIYPPTYGMFEERRHFSPGTATRAFDCAPGRIGVLICEDLWHLPLPYLLALDGAQVIVGMAASPTRLTGEEARLQIAAVNSEQHRSYARLLSSYLVFCNRVGFDDGVNFWGGSHVVGPDGEILAQAAMFDQDLIFAEIDDNEIRRARRFSRHFLDDDASFTLAELRRITGGRRF